MTQLLVNIIGLFSICWIVWWFWLTKVKTRASIAPQSTVEIAVEGGVYLPDHIAVAPGQTVRLSFLRLDPSPCAATVIFDALDLNVELPLNEKKVVTLKPEKVGEYDFACPMGMYRGKLIVE